MTELKCPFCNETELEKGIELQGGGFILGCPKCKKIAHDVFWQELITTRKALDVAVGALKIIGSGEVIEHSVLFHEDDNKITIANKALEQINEITQNK